MRVAKKILKSSFFIFELSVIIITLLAIYLAMPLQAPSKQLFIPKGSNQKIIAYLRGQNVALTKADAYILSYIGQPQSGWIDLGRTQMSRFDFLKALTTAKAALFTIKLIPGETTYTILYLLAKRYGYPLEVLQKEYNRLAPYPEGVLLAESYFVPKGIEAAPLMRYLVHTSLVRHKKIAQKFLGSYNQKLWFKRIITIASIVQKEAADAKEMPLIASVIYNRLRIGMPLQMDGALNYGKFSHVAVTPQRIRTDTTRFNTYKYKGLPPYPVCIVSLHAIKAAIKPARTHYLYFVKGVDGKHIFSTSYKEHLRHIKDVQKRNKKR